MEWNLFNSTNLIAGVCNLLQYVVMFWKWWRHSENVIPETPYFEPIINQDDGEEELIIVNAVHEAEVSIILFSRPSNIS